MRTANTRGGGCRFNEWYPSAAKSIKIVCFLTAAYLKSPYCMKEFGIAQAMDKLLVVACEPIRDITAVDPSKYPHASTALAYLLGGGGLIAAVQSGDADAIEEAAAAIEQIGPQGGDRDQKC